MGLSLRPWSRFMVCLVSEMSPLIDKVCFFVQDFSTAPIYWMVMFICMNSNAIVCIRYIDCPMVFFQSPLLAIPGNSRMSQIWKQLHFATFGYSWQLQNEPDLKTVTYCHFWLFLATPEGARFGNKTLVSLLVILRHTSCHSWQFQNEPDVTLLPLLAIPVHTSCHSWQP